MYVGHSPCHTGSAVLVLNPKTMQTSPQYHLVFDNEFNTIYFFASEEVSLNWAETVEKLESRTTTDYYLAQIWIKAHEDATKPILNQENILMI